MTFADWLRISSKRIRQKGARGVEAAMYELYLGMWRRANELLPNNGTNVYEREWDILIILDGCRPDLFGECANEYSFIEEWDTIRSLASDSPTWMEHTFVDEYSEEIRSTAYVSGNAFCELCLDPSNFSTMDIVSNYVWNDELQTIPPRPITDRAISTFRNENPKRMIVHYMQPHIPFIRATSEGYERIINAELVGMRRDKTKDPLLGDNEWDLLRTGELGFETFWEAYRAALKCVLDDVNLLLSNVDASKVVLTADHGNAIGEYGIYGHPASVPFDSIRSVPWCVTSATDLRTYSPTLKAEQQSVDVEQRLAHLGYK